MAELKIKADSGGGTVSFKGPSTTTSNAAVQLTLPVDDGTANQYLKTDGSGALSWATVSSPVTALNNATANELVTVGSTTTELDAESGLTFDGTHLSITDGDLKVATAGHGIDFSANTSSSTSGASMASELLDWYEEGTFTPTIEDWGSETAGNTTHGGDNHGKYTRIGNTVFIQICAHQTSNSSSAGNRAGFYVGGLPFTQDTTDFGCMWDVHTEGITADSNHHVLLAAQQASSQKFRIYNRDYDSNSSGWPDLPTGEFRLFSTFHYRCT